MIRVVNLTNFFNRELFMYSLGDIKFKKPIALKKVAYITVFLLIWTIPLILSFGFPSGPFSAFFVVVLPIIAGNFAARPVFGGKGLLDFLKTLSGFVREPRGWLDFKNSMVMDKDVYYVESEIWIGRRRELEMLAEELSR